MIDFYHIMQNAYANDHQIYYSDTNPLAREESLCKKVETAIYAQCSNKGQKEGCLQQK